MMKVLILASVASMIKQFNLSNIEILLKNGYEVHVACNFKNGNTCSDEVIEDLKQELKKKNIFMHNIPFARNIKNLYGNAKAYYQLKKLIEKNQYQIIHCQSPIGGVITRLAVKNIKNFRGKIIYTAHGFHFFSKSPKKNWLLYYPIEKYLAHYTDILITINKEDYKRAKKYFHLKENGKVVYLPGVGIDVQKIQNTKVNKEEKRRELGVNKESFLLVNAAELSQRKNQKVLLKALSRIVANKDRKNIQLLLCGTGLMEKELKEYAKKLKIEKNVIFAGYRTDLYEIYKIADCFIFSSLQEGLPVALMEAMAAGLPVICSAIRGNIDLIQNKKGGYLVKENTENLYIYYIKKLMNNKEECRYISKWNQKKIELYDIKKISDYMEKIYKECIAKKNNNKKVLVYLKNKNDPSSFYRLYQYFRKKSDKYIKTVDCVTSKTYFSYYNNKTPHFLWKLFMMIESIIIPTVIILWDLLNYHSDIIIINRKIFPRVMPFYANLLLKKYYSGRVVYWDFDDNIIEEGEITNKECILLKKYADKIIVTNNYLKNTLSKECYRRVFLLSTTDKAFENIIWDSLLTKRAIDYKKSIVLIWVGTKGNLDFLRNILKLIRKAAQYISQKTGKKVILKCICNEKLVDDKKQEKSYLEIQNIKWSRNKTLEELKKAHIGLMPLEDNLFTRGKAGFKAVQYIGAGLPAILSKIGYNNYIIENGKEGFLVQKDLEWIEAIVKLAVDEELWYNCSLMARKRWKTNFDSKNHENIWKKLISGE